MLTVCRDSQERKNKKYNSFFFFTVLSCFYKVLLRFKFCGSCLLNCNLRNRVANSFKSLSKVRAEYTTQI